ncbi:Kinesin-like protein KIP2, partial [Dictyocoela roeselum]
SYIEIYNEQIFDLINSNKKLRLFSVENTLVIANLTKVEVKTLKNALEILEKSEKNRSISQTKFNDRSSRSHTLFQIEYKSYNQVSVLNLIDLAGSEKAADDRERRMEGAYINRSLLALGSVVENLISNTNSENVYSETPDKIVSTSGNCMSKNKRAATSAKSTISNSYVNFRNSKLTRILQSSMIGDVELISLCMINEDKSCVEESISTLNFASRMSQVKVKTKVSKGSNNKMKRCPYCRKEVSIDSLISEENNNCYLKPVSYSKKDKTGNFNQQNNTSSEETFNANEDNNRPAKSFENSNQTSALENESGFKNSHYLNMERFEEKVGYKIQDDFRHDYAIFEEKMLLLKRIDTLENMLTSLLAKNPSHKSTEIYLLEKNVFNLQYDLIKKKQRNFRG